MSTYRYNGKISRVKKRRIKRSQNEKTQRQHKKKKKRPGRIKRQAETVTYDLGKRNESAIYNINWIIFTKMSSYDIAFIN